MTTSRDLLPRMLWDEEEHADILGRRFDPIKRIGITRCIVLNSAPRQGPPAAGRPAGRPAGLWLSIANASQSR